jgi:diguanylate cyclase (GGDEF)-like protein
VLVTGVSSAAAGLGRLSEEAPDLVLLDWALPEQSAPVLVRAMRADPQLSLTPVLAVTTADHDQVFEDMLAAGVDAPMVRPISRPRLLAEAVHRARRSRRLEALLRRDALTGFLTRSALEDELESVLAHCQRSGEEVTFVLLDIDHFRRVNEQLGRRIGDQILLYVAAAIGRRVRASDFAIRMGGEEFGMLLRQCGSLDAEALTDQLRTGLVERPPEVEGIHFPIRLSAGIASTASTGATSAGDLLWAAEQALLDAKQTGRDKVVIARKR